MTAATTPNDDFKLLDNEKLLERLAEERLPPWSPGKPYRAPDDKLVEAITDELVRRGVYPKETAPGNPNDVYTMVRGWGADWYKWSEPLQCKHCKSDLRDLEGGPPFKREIGMYDMAQDRTTHTVCPDCRQRL